MPDFASKSKSPLGLSRRPERRDGFVAADWIAFGLSIVWLSLCALFFLFVPSEDGAPVRFDGFVFVMTVLAVFMPVALIWVATFAARANKVMRDESERLQAAIDAMRQAYISSNQANTPPVRSETDKKVEEVLKLQKRAETMLSQISEGSVRAVTPAPIPAMRAKPVVPTETPDEEQPALALVTPAETLVDQISTDDFIRALNFPEDEADREGFRALRIALKDRTSAGLVRSAQDVLTLLAEDGIYMDDLSPDKAKPEVWRQFALGTRGRAVGSLGGVRDRASLALTAGRMRQDPVFRDVAHHFLRKFDQTFAQFEKSASDADIVSLSETRTARAFMLLGRVSGVFD